MSNNKTETTNQNDESERHRKTANIAMKTQNYNKRT